MDGSIDITGCGTAEDRRDRGPYQQVYSGKPFFFLDPRPDDINIDDIAASLSKQCRYMGHCTTFYSVAQHSVMVSEIVPPNLALIGLLHDASEAYVSDITRPLKIALEMRAPGALHKINEVIEQCIAKHFGIAWDDWKAAHDEVKKADNIALSTELRDLMAHTGECNWGTLPVPLSWPIQPLPPRTARIEFLLRFADIARGYPTIKQPVFNCQ